MRPHWLLPTRDYEGDVLAKQHWIWQLQYCSKEASLLFTVSVVMSKYLQHRQIFKINKPAPVFLFAKMQRKPWRKLSNSYFYNKNSDQVNILFYWLWCHFGNEIVFVFSNILFIYILWKTVDVFSNPFCVCIRWIEGRSGYENFTKSVQRIYFAK